MNEAEKQVKTQETEFRWAAKNLLNLLPVTSGNLLDVGCGIGWVVDEANGRGFKALGIDSDFSYIHAGKKYLKCELIVSSLEKFKTDKKFDVIVLKHILEHIVDPKGFLQKVRRLLKPNGVVVVSCPNMHSLMGRLFLEKWYGLVPMQHRWQYTQNNLPKVLEKNGFKVERVLLSNMWYKVPGWKGIIFAILLFIADITNSGDLVTVVARKTK